MSEPRVVLSRRALFLSAAAAPALGCDGNRPTRGFLGAMDRWNLRAQGGLYSPSRAQRDPGSEAAARSQWPPYWVSGAMPLAPKGWALRVGGMVARPRSFTLEDLMRMTRTDMRVRHHCVEGWTAVASWHGVRLAELARVVGADRRADYVEFRSFDSDYYSSWDLASALHAQTLLAYGREGGALPPAYGAPLRLYGAVKLGYKNVKYLTEVNFLARNPGGYWENRGYEWFAGV